MTATMTALCDRFTKNDGKRGKPARDSLCAVCEVVWTDHFNEKVLERGHQQPVLHADKVRVIEPPKRRRAARSSVESPSARVEAVEPEVEPEVEEQEPELPDLMLCGHPVESLSEVEGQEVCSGCVKRVAFWEKMKRHGIEK